jgi:Fe2+ or Zn2+ uptake regulation protein
LLPLLPAQTEAGWAEALVKAALKASNISVNHVTMYRVLDRLAEAALLYALWTLNVFAVLGDEINVTHPLCAFCANGVQSLPPADAV